MGATLRGLAVPANLLGARSKLGQHPPWAPRKYNKTAGHPRFPMWPTFLFFWEMWESNPLGAPFYRHLLAVGRGSRTPTAIARAIYSGSHSVALWVAPISRIFGIFGKPNTLGRGCPVLPPLLAVGRGYALPTPTPY